MEAPVIITKDLTSAILNLIKAAADRGVFRLEEFEFVAIVNKHLSEALKRAEELDAPETKPRVEADVPGEDN